MPGPAKWLGWGWGGVGVKELVHNPDHLRSILNPRVARENQLSGGVL